MRGVVSLPSFRQFWASETLSITGQQLAVFALPLIAVTTLNASPGQMGLLVTLSSLPTLLLSLYAGLLVDRTNRLKLMSSMSLLRAGTAILLLLALWSGQNAFALLCLVAFLIGSFAVVYNVAYQSVVPHVVERDQLTEANSKLEATRSFGDVLGTGLAGGMIGLLGYAPTIGVSAAAFLLSSIALRRLDALTTPPPPRAGSAFSHIREGFHYVLGHPLIRPLMLFAGTFNAAQGIADALLIYYLSRSVGLTPAQIGLVYMGSNIGLLCGALLGERLPRYWGHGRTALVAAICVGVGMLLVPLAAGPLPVVISVLMAGRFLYGMGNLMFFVQHISIRQAVTPAELQGRMNATIRFLAGGMYPLGALCGGLLAEHWQTQSILLLAGIITALGVLWVIFSPISRTHTLPTISQGKDADESSNEE